MEWKYKETYVFQVLLKALFEKNTCIFSVYLVDFAVTEIIPMDFRETICV